MIGKIAQVYLFSHACLATSAPDVDVSQTPVQDGYPHVVPTLPYFLGRKPENRQVISLGEDGGVQFTAVRAR